MLFRSGLLTASEPQVEFVGRRLSGKGAALGAKIADLSYSLRSFGATPALAITFEIPRDLERPTAGAKLNTPEFQVVVKIGRHRWCYEIPFVEVKGA